VLVAEQFLIVESGSIDTLLEGLLTEREYMLLQIAIKVSLLSLRDLLQLQQTVDEPWQAVKHLVHQTVLFRGLDPLDDVVNGRDTGKVSILVVLEQCDLSPHDEDL
jgi:hypothetical protein